MPDASQFDTDRSYPGRSSITFSNPPINMFVPTTIVELRASVARVKRSETRGKPISRSRVTLRSTRAAGRRL